MQRGMRHGGGDAPSNDPTKKSIFLKFKPL
jgi:hypothetical protein